MSFLARSVTRIKPSPTVAVTTRAAELKAAGRNVIGLGAGEPDFDTPDHIKDAAIEAIRRGETKYTPVHGTPALRQAIQEKFRKENDLSYDLDEIAVSSGGKQVIYNAIMATVNSGDEVVIAAPYWVSYPDIVLLANGIPVTIKGNESQGFKITPEQLEEAITPRTKWVVLNSPSNPTGATYSEDELVGLGEILKRHEHVLIMTDDIYEHIVYEGSAFKTLAQVSPFLKGRVLTVNGVSKAFSMTGWRVGYAGGPAKLIKAMAKVQSQSSTHTSSVSQAAAVAALNGPMDFLKKWMTEFRKRRDLVVGRFNAVECLSCAVPQGAFYVYPSCSGVLGKTTPSGKLLKNDTDFVTYLLEAEGIAVVQGAAFGLEPYFRVSYATSTQALADACQRIELACDKLS